MIYKRQGHPSITSMDTCNRCFQDAAILLWVKARTCLESGSPALKPNPFHAIVHNTI